MLKKVLMTAMIMLSSTMAVAEEYMPFGIPIGSTSSYFPHNLGRFPAIDEPIKVNPPNPIQYFNDYAVYFNYEGRVSRIAAVGKVQNGQCFELTQYLLDILKKTYPNYKTAYAPGASYAYRIDRGPEKIIAYIHCANDIVRYGMYMPDLEKEVPKLPEVNTDNYGNEINL